MERGKKVEMEFDPIGNSFENIYIKIDGF